MSNATKHEDRTTKFTDQEFSQLERYADGSIRDLSTVFVWLTDSQRARVSEDDDARLEDLDEELRILIAEARVEFGLA